MAEQHEDVMRWELQNWDLTIEIKIGPFSPSVVLEDKKASNSSDKHLTPKAEPLHTPRWVVAIYCSVM